MDDNNSFLIPKHRKLEAEEIKVLLEQYSIDKVHLPKIKLKDAALKDFEDTEIGDVFEIERESFAGKTKYYRVVEE